MTPLDWLSLLVVVGYAAALGWTLQRGGMLWHTQEFRIVCPRGGAPVECRALQNVRTGQWVRIVACSPFTPRERVTCERECVQQVNLGFERPHVRAA